MQTSHAWNELAIRKGSISQQKARETNGRPNREQMAINSEIAGDNPSKHYSHGRSVDTKSINAATQSTKIRQAMDLARIAFGPRLIRKDGTAIYRFQVKRK